MQLNKKNWLSHLEKSVPITVSGDRLSIYTIALEGWRRGLKVNFYDVKYREKSIVRYSIADKEKEVKFVYSTGPNVTDAAKKIAASKTKTKEYLTEANVPVPKGKRFTRESNDEVVEYAINKLHFPIVLKPSGGKMGRGVVANIKNEKELRKALSYVRERLGFSNIILEEFIPGEEYRLYVINGEMIAAMNRVPANILGDGKKTIRELIASKNDERQRTPSVRGRPIKIDTEVKRNIKAYGYKLNSIPKAGEKLLLRKNSNISSGGDPIDVTDLLEDEVKQAAVMAAQSVPGLSECGVDLIVDERDGKGKVIELNTSVGLGGHLFPVEGKSRDIPGALIDYYFPETKRLTADLYFDFTKVTSLIKSGNVHEVVLPILPEGKFVKQSLTIEGKLHNVGFLSFFRQRARYCNLNGFVETKQDGTVYAVIAGTEENIKSFKRKLLEAPPISARIDHVEEKEWQGILEAGFIVVKDSEKRSGASSTGTSNFDMDNEEIQKLLKMNQKLEKKIELLEKKNEKYEKSNSWRVTKPLRKISSRLKK